MQLTPLSDQGVLIYCGDENEALATAARVRQAKLGWVVDVVQAYTSVAVYFDLDRVDYFEASRQLTNLGEATTQVEGQEHVIPCCYALGPDLERMARATNLGVDDVIRLHSGTSYTVYAIGFCPGFPYLGYLPEPLCGVPRLDSPRLRVERGSVGLTGRQTGIYTLERPGGWNIIGRTPVELVDVAAGYFPLRTGDRVRFVPIDQPEFRERLSSSQPR